jgi:hypothetical protein
MRFGQRRNPNFGSKFAIENMEIRMAQTRRLAREANAPRKTSISNQYGTLTGPPILHFFALTFPD